jgi:serine phosphatase RsbU (regulator of sigma subunit)/transcriptional regulator with GAF, ATPase, and Fis domain/anti-sigma regulatory factor (Ser/Thr protein kinase)
VTEEVSAPGVPGVEAVEAGAQSTAGGLQELAAELSAAVTSTEVAHSLIARLPTLLGAVGGSLGLVHGESLVVIDPGRVRRATLPAGLRLQLDASMPITRAALSAAPVHANTREEIERAFPEGARLAPYALAFLAVPLMAGERVVGSMSFPFDSPDVVDADLIALAQLAAALGGQAIERSQLYERERALREGLERIARVAPRFAAESPDDLLAAICREARATFDADAAELWESRGDEARLLCREPADPEREPGAVFPRDQLAGFAEALERVGPVFTQGGSTDGPAEAPFKMLGGRAFLQIPILAEAGKDRVLTLQWEHDLLAMPPEMLVLARRFADHTSIALEHAARQQAQAAATRSARETRRLLDATTALAAATTPELVGAATLEELGATLGSDAGALVALDAGEPALVAAAGYSPDELGRLRRLIAAAASPISAALETNEVTIHESREALARACPELAAMTGHRCWLSIPLSAGGRVVGAVGLSFAAPGGFEPAELDYVTSVARQAGQALERATLFATEHRARERAEQLAGDLAELHEFASALGAAESTTEVGELLCQRVDLALGAVASAVYLRTGTGGFELLGRSSELDATAEGALAIEPPPRLGDALATTSTLWLASDDDWARLPESGPLRAPRSALCAVIPLSVVGRPAGLLVAWFPPEQPPDDRARRLIETMARQTAQPLERVRLLESERAARVRTERLQRLTAALSAALTADQVAETFLTEALGAIGASGAALFLLDDDGRRIRVLASRGYPDSLVELWRSANGRGLRRPGLGTPDPERVVEDLERLGHRTSAIVPIRRGATSLGIAVISWLKQFELAEDERRYIESLVAQCGLALDRAAQYEAERNVAETLQRSVLPESIPSMQGVQVAARYLPGTTALEVGGDWFDTFALPDGRLAFAVGDIVGKGVRAAATMAQLRNGMRALALEDARPESTVTRINRLLDGITDTPFATLAYLTLDPRTFEATIVSAGHLPPLVVGPKGETGFLGAGQNLPLGVDATLEYQGSSTMLVPGSIVVLYTDGLVERHGRSIDDGLDRLADTARAAGRDPERLADTLVETLVGEGARHDDVAVLVVALAETPLPDLSLALPPVSGSLETLRVELGHWLTRAAIPQRDARDILLAAWEAGANAIEHADGRGDVTVHATLLGDRVRIDIRDCGPWKETPTDEDRGFGLRLIQALTTTTEIDRSAAGTRVSFERSVTAQSAGEGGSTG